MPVRRGGDTLGREVFHIEIDFAAQIERIQSSPADGTLKRYCLNSKLSTPISYVYSAYAVTTQSQFLQAQWLQWFQGSGRDCPDRAVDSIAASELAVVDPTCELGEGESWSIARVTCGGQAVGSMDLEGPVPEFAGTFDDDGVTPMPTDHYRLREGIERFFITDINNPASSARAQSELLIMWDAYDQGALSREGDGIAQFNHVPGGSNVLYMDGHVNFVRLNEAVPMLTTALPSTSLAGTQDSYRPEYTWWLSQISYFGGHG